MVPDSCIRRSLTIMVVTMAMLFQVSPVVAENPCVEFNPLTVNDVAGATWVGRILSVDRTHELQPAYSISVDQVYAGANNELQVGTAVKLVSGGCHSLVGLEMGATYLLSTPAVPSPGGLYFSRNLAAWRIRGDRASYVVMWPKTPVSNVFKSASTLQSVVALVAPNADLPETDMAPSRADYSGTRDTKPIWPGVFLVAFIAALYATGRRVSTR